MEIDRREFVALTVGALASAGVCGCASNPPNPEVSPAGTPVDVGSESQYSKDGLYDAFGDRGFFLVRRGEELFAVASICTHNKCKIKSQADRTFLCPCHGSKFDPDGRVITGPATRDLPRFQTSRDERGHILVSVARSK